jgi:hypothetical protein
MTKKIFFIYIEMNLMMNLLLLFALGLGFMVLSDEFNLVKMKFPDTTKVLMLMIVVVLFIKTNPMETFLNNYSTVEEGRNYGKKCGYDKINLFNEELDLDKHCNYERKTDNVELKENLDYQFPNAFKTTRFTPDGLDKPSLNGSEEQKNISNFIFNQNIASPDCCPSIYSTSTGCICPNKQQNMFISSRGGNSTYANNPF